MHYALLLAPSSNRVYAGEAPRLARAELASFARSVWGVSLLEVTERRIGGVPYLGFTTDAPLGPRDTAFVSAMSAAYALFEVDGDEGGEVDGVRLRPVRLTPLARYDDDLITIPKYAGKTNEQFTTLLLNLTVLASERRYDLRDRRLVVLDPLAGRGTTLNHALMYGYDALGIEIDGGQVDAYAAFLRTWLRRKRIKHTVELRPVRRAKKHLARRLSASLAPDRDAHRAGDLQQVTLFHADAADAREFLRAGCCDVIVTDTPYGVAHGSRAEGRVGRDRRPLELLAGLLPAWAELLRQGGAVGLAINTVVVDRDRVAELLTDAGLEVVEPPVSEGFVHRVDQAITRDIVIARKPVARNSAAANPAAANPAARKSEG